MSRTRLSPTPNALAKHAQRFQELKRGLDQLEYFCKGTVLKRMTKCGKAYCACRSDPNKRHGPYFELTYKVDGKTVNLRLSPLVRGVRDFAHKAPAVGCNRKCLRR